jgi:hypothetical protein
MFTIFSFVSYVKYGNKENEEYWSHVDYKYFPNVFFFNLTNLNNIDVQLLQSHVSCYNANALNIPFCIKPQITSPFFFLT